MIDYRRAIEFDLLTRAGVLLESAGGLVSWGVVYSLVSGFSRQWGTHFHAALNGFAFPVSYGEAVAALHAQAFINANFVGEGSPPDLPFPWSVKDTHVEPVSGDDLRAAESVLAAFSALPD